MVDVIKPNFILLTECHIEKGEPINLLIPAGYKVVVKRWRSKYGGGLLIMAEEHLLCDPLDTSKYFEKESAEIIAMEYRDVIYVDAYTNTTSNCHKLIAALQQLRNHRPDKKMIIAGDLNMHNAEWLHSGVPTDEAGELVEDFAMINSFHQLV